MVEAHTLNAFSVYRAGREHLCLNFRRKAELPFHSCSSNRNGEKTQVLDFHGGHVGNGAEHGKLSFAILTKTAERDLADVQRLGYSELPICIAKTHSSLSDDPSLRGRPRDFEITVESIRINSGAGFLVVLTGDILRMPGLPRRPLAESIDVKDGKIIGLE